MTKEEAFELAYSPKNKKHAKKIGRRLSQSVCFKAMDIYSDDLLVENIRLKNELAEYKLFLVAK